MTIQRAFHATALAAVLVLAMPFAASAAVEQAADIYSGPGDIRGSISNSPQVFKSNNGTLFFTASTPSDSRELWATDGTSGGTHRLTDAPGYNPTLINSAALLGDELYFVPSSADGPAVWKTDGTVAGTQKAFEPIPGSNNYRILALTAANGKLYFGTEINGQYSIWVSDGTAAGTRKITTIGAYHFGEHYFAPAGGKVVFTADDGTHGFEPWVTDGTAAGTELLEDIRGSEGSKPRDFVAWGDKTLFTTFVGSLFFTDGNDVTAINAADGAATGTEADDVTVVGGDVYYTARTYVSSGTVFKGRHLWHADGSGADATLVDPGSVSDEFTADNLAAAGSDLYFTVSTGTNETLYKWDGTAKTAVLDAGTDTIGNVIYADGKLYFTRTGSLSGLFVYDGATIQPLKDVEVKVTATSGGKLFMAADDGTHGTEPWISDGTPAGTHMIDNLASPDAGSYPDDITVAGGKLLFAAYWLGQSYEPSISDGTAAGTRLLQDIAPGTDESDPSEFTAVGDTVYFEATDSDGDNLLWKVAADGSGATSVGTGFDDPEELVALSGELYFAAWTIADSQYELWKSDGTAAGTVAVSKDADVQTLTVAGDKLFLAAWGPGDSDPQLWVSDGTEAGTKELTSGLDDLDFGPLTAIGGKFYFMADDGAHGDEVWVSDGTVAGTHLVKDVVPGTEGSDPYALTAYDGYLYFVAFTAEAGYEVWRTDGTAAGTGLFADITPGAQSSDPDDLTVAGDKLYFTAYTPAAGYELWATDGGKPVQVKDINPGSKGSEPVDLTAIGNRIVFTASDGVAGYEPWISDGTAAGTHMIGDVNIGADSSNPDNYVLFKRQLFFAADDGTTGDELWHADINRRPIAADTSATVEQDTAFDGVLKATDPDGDALTFGIAEAPTHGQVKIVDTSTGAFTYTPADGYSGKDSFRFNADDGLASSSATVSIQVQGGAPSDDDTPPPSDGGGAGSGGSGGGGWGVIGGLLMLGVLSRKRAVRRR